VRIFPKIRVRPYQRRRAVAARRPPLHGSSSTTLQSAPLLDFSQAVRSASSVENLYESITSMVRQAFSANAVSLFIRDDETGDFTCHISTVPTPSPEKSKNGDRVMILPSDAFVIRRLRSLSSPVQVDADELKIWSEALKDAPQQVFEKRMRERETLQQTRSALLVPLKTKNDLIGALSLGERTAGRFSPDEQAMLEGIGGQLALVVENTKLLGRMVEHERLQAELSLAAEVQRNLFPTTNPELPGIEVCGFCQPASQVGGDYFDFISLADGSTGVCIADVAGKGIAAALLMSVVQASLRAQLLNDRQHAIVPAVVSLLNRLLCASVSTARYVTCFYAQISPTNDSFRFVNAGHNPPLLFTRSAQTAEGSREGGEFRRLATGGPVLGLFPDASFEEDEVVLRCGDVLVAYTDGVTEAMNSEDEEFSEDRLRTAIVGATGSAKEILETIVSRVVHWSRGMGQHDDITVVVLRRL
jgi:sigma-B regulation protein RsbU (phosphoserine phosphatase)